VDGELRASYLLHMHANLGGPECMHLASLISHLSSLISPLSSLPSHLALAA
jgi:hypothetical protein